MAPETGVRVHDPERAFEGYTLYCETYDPPLEGETGTIYLIDMDGEPVHTWTVETALQSYCRLRPDGNLLYPTRDRSDIGAAGLREIDPDGEVVWSYHCRADHDFQVLEDGNLLVHTIADHMAPAIGPELKRNPYIVEITPGKELAWEWRGEEHFDELRDCLSEGDWRHVRERIENSYPFDWAHNNTCQVVPESDLDDERFAPGNVVFSYRSLDTIGVIDRPSGEIVWAWGPGELDGQHKPHVVGNGNLLVFDNGTERGYSRVIEVDPLTETVEWEYAADPPDAFYSPYISGAQRLPNGNTLICEGSESRLFEVTEGGETVWEFVNPYRDDASRGSVYRCLRYPPEDVASVLAA